MKCLFLFLFLIGCIEKRERIILATTTSLENSGLLTVLLKEFKKKEKIEVDVIPVGTKASLRIGMNGDCDIIIGHSKKDEEEFIKKGFGINRREFIKTDFVILGPRNDPAEIKNVDIFKGLKNIKERKIQFVSRGDFSGTDIKEKELWRNISIKPNGKWYIETGQGMVQTLMIAEEKNAYCLSDRATYLTWSDKISLVILKEEKNILKNIYSVIVVNHKKGGPNKYAIRLADWLMSQEVKNIIKGFKIKDEYPFSPIYN